MRKIKPKKKEEIKVEEKNEQEDIRNQLPFRTTDYIFYLLFFVMGLISEIPSALVFWMGILFIIGSVMFYGFKKISYNTFYRMLMFFLLSILAWPINILIHRFI